MLQVIGGVLQFLAGQWFGKIERPLEELTSSFVSVILFLAGAVLLVLYPLVESRSQAASAKLMKSLGPDFAALADSTGKLATIREGRERRAAAKAQLEDLASVLTKVLKERHEFGRASVYEFDTAEEAGSAEGAPQLRAVASSG